MTDTLETHAKEESTYVITAAFTDEAGSALTPKAMTWTLTDMNGTVINDREDVAIDTPTSSEDIVLSGDDLQITGADDDGLRILTLEGTYDSDYGSDLPLKDAIIFQVDDLDAVT